MAYDPEIAKTRRPDPVVLAYGVIFTELGLFILVVEWPDRTLLALFLVSVPAVTLWHEWKKRRRRSEVGPAESGQAAERRLPVWGSDWIKPALGLLAWILGGLFVVKTFRDYGWRVGLGYIGTLIIVATASFLFTRWRGRR